MITTHLKWSDDISKAPKGEYVTTTYQTMVKGKPHEVTKTEHAPTKILALTKCGKVVSTYWLPAKQTASGALLDGGRWSGLATGEEPLRWALWPDAAELIATHEALKAAGALAYAEEDA